MLPSHGVPVPGLSHVPSAQGSTSKPQSCGQSTGFSDQTPVKFPGHRVPESSLSEFLRPQGSRIKPQSSCQSTGFQNQASVILSGHRVPESSLSHIVRLQGSRIHRCHFPRSQGSRIKPQSCCQAIGYHHHNSVIISGHRFPESNGFPVTRQQGTTIQTDVMFPGQNIPQSNISHVPRPMLSRIKPQSYSQATWFQNQTSVVFRGHRVPE